MTSSRRRIALLAPLVAPIREPYLGGAQALLRDLAVVFARRGHDVTLYAAQGTDAAALPGVRLREVAVNARAVRPADFGANHSATTYDGDAAMDEAFAAAFSAIAAHTDEHDLIHAHAYDAPAFTRGALQSLPIAHTLHMPNLHGDLGGLLARLAPPGQRTRGQPWLVTVSQWCAGTYATTCRIDAVIPNGIDLDSVPFGASPAAPPYLLFAGRLAPEKGATDAIAIAREAGYPLTLAGGVYDREYAERDIFPLLNREKPSATWVGQLPHASVWSLMAGATAVLVPSRWDEPFGLAACEAQAAGAPVIAYARGGLCDIVADGDTGALVTPGDVASAAAAVPHMADIDRSACRARVAARFSLDRMAEAHESLYARMLDA